MSLVDKYIPLVTFLEQALGSNFEIVLHDVTQPDNSIVAIGNNHISGRQVGGPITDLALKIVREGLEDKQDFIANYKGRLGNGNLTRSSTYFIKNEQGVIEAALCINVNISPLLETRKYIDGLLSTKNDTDAAALYQNGSDVETAVEVFENLNTNIDGVVNAIIDKILNEYSVAPERMSVDEKIEVVKKLSDHGLFMLKGGLAEVAMRMNLSEATIYRYLNKIKN